MRIEKEELSLLIDEEGYPLRFLAPIHPRLLDRDIYIEKELAYQLFSQAQSEALGKMKSYAQTLPKEGLRKELERFSEYRHSPTFLCTDTGFVRSLGTEGATTGSLIFENKERSQQTMDSKLLSFSEQKLSRWCIPGSENRLYAYKRHNVDSIQNAFLLQSWARLYVNAALELVL